MTKAIEHTDQFHPTKSHACDRCLSVWPRVPYREEGADIFRIEESAETLLTSACEVCQVLGTALQKHQEWKSGMTGPMLRWARWLGHSGRAVFHYPDGTKEGDYRIIGMVKVWYPEPSIADDWKSVETKDGRIDFDPIRGWLDQCSKLHIRCKLSIEQEPYNLKVIDCAERSVIAAPVGCQYLALSYVWGGVFYNTDKSASHLPRELPRTIEDSMKATLLLGYKYLWVDAFCIQQDDTEDKHRQIQQMDLIYTSAELTLIAAAGDDSSYGLPGVSKERKVRYRDATVGDVCVSYVPPTVHRIVNRSRWSTRGWTFQEGYLSRRRLYFTESAVLFICNQSEEYEGFQRCASESDVFMLEGTLNPRALGARSDGASGHHKVMRLIERYSARKLSYDNDALNAIRGVLNYHRTKDQPIDTIWGIPYRLAQAEQRIICISWGHASTAIRRPEYPSWSPLGWNGSVEFAAYPHQFEISEKDASSISDHVQNGIGNRHKEHPRHLRITVKLHRFPVVSIIRAGEVDRWDTDFTEWPRAFLVLPIGSATRDEADIKLYMHVLWDTEPPDDYDCTQTICAIIHDQDLRNLSMMVLQDHGTYYERIGFAMAEPSIHDYMIKIGEGFDVLDSSTNGIQTLRAKNIPGFLWSSLRDGHEEYLAWIRHAEPVTITLG